MLDAAAELDDAEDDATSEEDGEADETTSLLDAAAELDDETCPSKIEEDGVADEAVWSMLMLNAREETLEHCTSAEALELSKTEDDEGAGVARSAISLCVSSCVSVCVW